MAAVSDIPVPVVPAEGASRRATALQWRRRSRMIHGLRVLLPVLIAAILGGLTSLVAYNAFTTQRTSSRDSNDPIRLIKPHFVGRDKRGRPFILTSVTATRDPQNYQRVFLDKPVLVLDSDGANPQHVSGDNGLYHEDTGMLEVSHHVHMFDARGAFDTEFSLFNTKTGELVGSVPVQGAGPLGEIQSRSYGVYDQGARAVFTGAVHTRLQPK
ncbi:LPS export ABC transporter periplasmic protein LptC [Phenylobacterium sp.]|uniref:LPS export ABC transporter periplasmic protein LptC n=1 Tax=Phenylobacterium sp. TaxID=1871053 RepID=UPI00121A1618|nr:LPS export ABC transporter periplasmic protein LptC [Phenylobacterium sp.]THD59885.1 MAG: hypothetical protein E8A49_15115 [Phenylobacterium sp.]